MKDYIVKTYPSAAILEKKNQLAWKIAEVASDNTPVTDSVENMIVNRIIDNAAVAIASINRKPVITSRHQALAHQRHSGATIFGLPSSQTVHA